MSSQHPFQITRVGKLMIISLQRKMNIGKLMCPSIQGDILGVRIMLISPIRPHRLCLAPIIYLKMCRHPKPSTKVSLTYGAIIQLLPKAIGLLIKAAHRVFSIVHTYHRGMHS